MKYFLFFLFIFLQQNISAQEVYEYPFSKLEYFAPATQSSPQINDIKQQTSLIKLNIDLLTIEISSLFPNNELITNKYKIKSFLKKNDSIIYICIASNYSEVIIEFETKQIWVSRKITHNNIYHKYYN